MKNLGCFYGFLLLLLGCTSSGKHKEAFLKERNFAVSRDLLVSDSMKLEDTFDLLAWTIGRDAVAFVTYGLTEGFLSVYSYPACQKLYDDGKIGQGPDEFITLNAGNTSNNGFLILYDIMGRKLRQLAVGTDSVHVLQSLPLYVNQDGFCKPFTDISLVDGTRYLMKVDDMQTSAWELADLEQGKVVSSYVNSIRKAETSYTPFDFIQSVSDSIFLVAYKYIDRIEMYSISTNAIRPLLVYGNNQDSSDLEDYNDLPYYYISVLSYAGQFYCLKSADGTEKGKIVEVYDSKGDCQIIYMLERKVTSLAMDAEGYLVGYVPKIDGTVLYRFSLPSEKEYE